MRIALITLALTALVFIGSIIYSLAAKDGTLSLASKTSNSTLDTPIELETLKYQIKNEEKIKELIAKVEFSLTANTGIYDLVIFDKSMEYATYIDVKQGIKALPLSLKYDAFLKNMKALGSDSYTVNESKTFPFRSFYVNPPKADTLVRLVIEIESQCIAIEIPKTKFPTFKALLLKK